MNKLSITMKKIFFLVITIFCISCQLKKDTTTSLDEIWLTSIEVAFEESKKTNKPIFTFFTGKKWCSWCKKLEQQILSKEVFIEYAKENLILLELDFPRGKRDLPKKQIDLARKFRIQGYPTVILMDAETNLIGRTGYEAMTPKEYIAHLESFINK